MPPTPSRVWGGSLYPNTDSRMGVRRPHPGDAAPKGDTGEKGEQERQRVGLSLSLPHSGNPSLAGGVPTPQWSLKPGMGKARAKVSTRWRRSLRRRWVSGSCSRKVLKSWSLPGGGRSR